MSIPFTQYLLPDGRRKPVTIDMTPAIEERAECLIKAGCHFDIEVLTTGVIAMTCEDQDDNTLSLELCSNGPEVVGAVEKIVEQAYSKIFKKETK